MKKQVLVLPALRPPRENSAKRGPPFGNRNAFKHGKFTRERRALYSDIRQHTATAGSWLLLLSTPLAFTPLEGAMIPDLTDWICHGKFPHTEE